MQITKKDLEKSQVELLVSLSFEEFKPYIEKGAKNVSERVKIDGFRPGKVPYDVLKQKVGEITILEEAANLAIRQTIDEAFSKELSGRQPVGQPGVEITKLAPENPLEYKVTVSLLPEIELGDYKGLKIEKDKAEVSDKDVEKTLEELLNTRVKETASDKPAKKGDRLVLKIDLSVDKVPVEGGQAQGVNVVLGKEYMVPGFDEKVMGIKKGEEKEFSLNYPKDHHQLNLAGKKVDFKVTATDVFDRELPKLDDAFAKEMHFKDLADLKDAIKKNILADRERQTETKAELKMLDAIIEKSKFGDIPESVLNSESENMMLELEQNVTRQGGKFDDYLKSLNKTRDQLRLDLLPNAIKRVKTALIIQAIGEKEKVEVEHEAVHERLDALKKMYAGQEEILKQLDSHQYHHHIENTLFNEEVLKLLKSWNYADSGQQPQS